MEDHVHNFLKSTYVWVIVNSSRSQIFKRAFLYVSGKHFKKLVLKLISKSLFRTSLWKLGSSAQEKFNLSSKICQPWPTKLYQKERKKLTNTFATSELQEKKSCCITCFFFCFKVSSQLSLSQASRNLEKSIEVDAEIYKFSILQLHFHIEKVKERKIEVRSENFFFLNREKCGVWIFDISRKFECLCWFSHTK